MTIDHKRLEELEHKKGTIQYGESVTVPAPTGSTTPGGTGLQLLAKDLVRYRGDKTDLFPMRIYLGPWQPQPNMPVPSPLADPGVPYAQPTPWAPPSPDIMDNFVGAYYAKLQWGAGGVQHTAYVDWPARGCLLQLSGSYVQVDAAVSVPIGATVNPAQFPTLRATLGLEPGGGDSVRPATFTYPKQRGTLLPTSLAPTSRRWHFQIPPFARAFTPLVDVFNLFNDVTFTELRVAVQPTPAQIAGNVVPNAQTWFYVNTAPQDQGIDWPLEPFPIAGQIQGTAEGGVVTIEIDCTALTNPFDFTREIGCMFDLDL